MTNFQYQNPSNMSYLLSFLSFSIRLYCHFWTGKILDRFYAHPLSKKSCHYVYAAVFLLFSDSRFLSGSFWFTDCVAVAWIIMKTSFLINPQICILLFFPNSLSTFRCASQTTMYLFVQYFARCGYSIPPFHTLYVYKRNLWCSLHLSRISAWNPWEAHLH